ncbi:hypothetical protein [Parabacteroides pacaensis]|uniref:hypothetical protein n=1 Tax=Parabacteroides pacaensis TaxID=2086575 RepID=UPI00131CBDFE|nr:hypothetical protein [Parabacteroides pacaensis]
MRLKNILLGIVSACVSLTACMEETLIEEPHPGNASIVDVKVALAPSNVITKAGGVTTKAYATPEELNIQNCVLAIFEKEDSEGWKRVSSKYYSSLDETGKAAEENFSRLFTIVENVKLTLNKTYKMRVIANIDENNRSEYEACQTEEDFERIVEGEASDEYAFDAGKLLKSGFKEVKVDASTANTVIEIPLTLVAARINLDIKVKIGEVTFERTYYDMEAFESINLNMTKPYKPDELRDIFGGKAFTFQNWNEVKSNGVQVPTSGQLHYGDRPINMPSGSGVKGVCIPNFKAMRIDEYQGYVIELSAIKVKNIRTQAIAVLPLQENNFHCIEKGLSKDKELQRYTFYTYAKNVDSSLPLTIEYTGQVYKTTIQKQTPVTTAWFAFADTQNIWGSTGTKPIILDTGWSNSSTVFFTALEAGNWQEDSSIEVPKDDVTQTPVGTEYTQSFPIIPNDPVGPIANGHLYNVTATIKSLTITGELDVDIKEYGEKNVEDGFN